ncbi:MAG TPA: hypothetical protein VGP26_12745 [Actinophytocola sp.]|nr:hypothetical protein [Actinophytocola sp.]
MPEAVLTGQDDQLPGRSAVLARYAALLTAEPWSITPDIADLFAEHGLDAQAVRTATGVAAMFNYLTRVADASGIEFDYASPLPEFQPERDQKPVPRPDRESWPVVAEDRNLPGFPMMSESWRHWREYVLDSEEPLTRRERRLLARAAAQECCDRWQADELEEHGPRDDRDAVLDAFARKLSCRPWQMGPADLQALRDAGCAEPAVLHVISVVALQNAESRLTLGYGLTIR